MEAIPRSDQFTCVVNKRKRPAILMNAVGHMTAGLVEQYKSDTSPMRFRDFIDKDGTVHPSTSENGYVVLRSENSNQLRRLRKSLIERDIRFTDFTETMLPGDYVSQQAEFDQTHEEELEYLGICFFAPRDLSRELTRKFSLYTFAKS